MTGAIWGYRTRRLGMTNSSGLAAGAARIGSGTVGLEGFGGPARPSSISRNASTPERRGVQTQLGAGAFAVQLGKCQQEAQQGIVRRQEPQSPGPPTAAIAALAGTVIVRASMSSPSTDLSITGSAAMLKAPLRSLSTARRTASATSSLCTAWNLRPTGTGSTLSRPG